MKQAQSIMAVNIVVALLMVVFSYLWGTTIAAVVVDAALTPAEMKDPALVTAVSRAMVRYGSSQISLPSIVLGVFLCGLNVWGYARLKSESKQE